MTRHAPSLYTEIMGQLKLDRSLVLAYNRIARSGEDPNDLVANPHAMDLLAAEARGRIQALVWVQTRRGNIGAKRRALELKIDQAIAGLSKLRRRRDRSDG